MGSECGKKSIPWFSAAKARGLGKGAPWYGPPENAARYSTLKLGKEERMSETWT